MYNLATDIQKWHTLERVNHKGDLYFIIFKEQEPKGLTNEDIMTVKKELNCDTVLRANGYIYFCQQISNAEILEES
jgi:hypothetical protein